MGRYSQLIFMPCYVMSLITIQKDRKWSQKGRVYQVSSINKATLFRSKTVSNAKDLTTVSLALSVQYYDLYFTQPLNLDAVAVRWSLFGIEYAKRTTNIALSTEIDSHDSRRDFTQTTRNGTTEYPKVWIFVEYFSPASLHEFAKSQTHFTT